MAHIAKLGALTDELVTLLTSTSAKSDQARFSIHRESALRTLRSHNHLRTNQFEVASQLEGLEEKFRVYNKDPLADALKGRLDTLTGLDAKWAPEILHLLLELSDKPVSKSRLEDLDLLKEPEQDQGLRLKWEDLIADDPSLQDKKLWRNVDFAAESSGEDDFYADNLSELSEQTGATLPSSVNEDSHRRPEDYVIETISKEHLKTLREAQFWHKTPSVGGVALTTIKVPITELQASREVIFMLGGTATSLFETQSDELVVEPSKSFCLTHLSLDTFYELLKSFAEQGSKLKRLRSWIKRVEPIPLIQVFQGTIRERLADFDILLSIIHTRFLDSKEDIVVSLLSIREELASFIGPLVRVSAIIERLVSEPYGHAFRYLELLFDDCCTSQMAGDKEMYKFLGEMFFECFQIYLRPIRMWMEEGEVRQGDKVFFVAEATGDIEPSSLWQSRFKIRRTQDGILHAPKFLSTAANKIFTTGKSVVALKHLKHFRRTHTVEPALDFKTVCNPAKLELAPFPEIFDAAFQKWVQSKHHHASDLLRKTLFDSCGLLSSLEALSQLFFLSDGIVAAAFTNPVFDKLDTLNSSWNDGFTLTELVRSTFGSLPSVSPDRLRANVLSLSRKQQDVTTCRRTVKALSIIELKYSLPWPVQIILTPSTVSSCYTRIFTFLLQIRRSSHILSRRRLILDGSSSTGLDERALYYSLRTRILWFNQSLYYYISTLVLEPCLHKLRKDFRDAEDVDAMIDIHASYIKNVIDQSLLGTRLELIHKTILKVLDLGIKLEDAQAANELTSKEDMERQQEMMDMSMASLGLATPKRKKKQSHSFRQSFKEGRHDPDSSTDDEEKDVDVDLSILSTLEQDRDNILYVDKLRKMKSDFDKLVRFVASGLRGVARAEGNSSSSRSWDTFGEMIESGMKYGGSMSYR